MALPGRDRMEILDLSGTQPGSVEAAVERVGKTARIVTDGV
jgi:hypothetical protein